MLTPGSWESDYALALALHEEAAEAAYLCGDYESTVCLFEMVSENATSVLDKVKIHEVRIMALMAEGRMQEVTGPGLAVLELLGVSIPEAPDQESIDNEIQAVLELTRCSSCAWLFYSGTHRPELAGPVC